MSRDRGIHAVACVLALLLPASAWGLFPGDEAPPFTVRTLDGDFGYERNGGTPFIIYAYLLEDGYSEAMFSDASSIDRFLNLTSAPSEFLFLCHCDNDTQAESVAGKLRAAFAGALGDGGARDYDREDWKSRLHFGVEAVSSMSNWLPDVFEEWNSTKALLQVSSESDVQSKALLKRVDGHFGWLPHAPASDVTLVATLAAHSLCNDTVMARSSPLPRPSAPPTALVVPWTPGECSFATILQNAEATGAAAAVLYPTDPSHPLAEITCEGDDCSVGITLPATMISASSGADLARRLMMNETIDFNFVTESSKGRSIAIDSEGNLQQNGWPVWPWLASLGWSAQYLNFEAKVRRATGKDAGDAVVNLFDGSSPLHGDLTSTLSITGDLLGTIMASPLIQLDFQLGCTGKFDYECPEWDHVIQLFLCCGDETQCSACPQLIWSEKNATFSSMEVGQTEERCGPEVGRWMTPFRRARGRWLTDVTALRGAFAGQVAPDAPEKCVFRMRSVTWAATGDHYWLPRLDLRIGLPPAVKEGGPPSFPTIISLFGSRTFDKHFNDRKPYVFVTPREGLVSAKIRALITGHGSDEDQCAEFCAGISNIFDVNGIEYRLDFDGAGTQLGCTDQVTEGSIPNEHGTWFYGRNGWCDGMDVKPWTMDILGSLAPPGEVNFISFAGLYQERTPNPSANAGQILMSSFLILQHGSESGGGSDHQEV